MTARLLVEAGDCSPQAVDLAPGQPVTLGRSRDNVVVVRDEMVSRLHVKIFHNGGVWQLRDFGMNGTRVGGTRVNGTADLADGAVIEFGEVRLRFTADCPTRLHDPAAVCDRTPYPGVKSVGGGTAKGWVLPASGVAAAAGVIRTPAPTAPPPRPVELSGTKVHALPVRAAAPPAAEDPAETALRADELTALCRFMTAAVSVADPHELIRHALRTILNQTTATLAGYLGLDPADPIPKLVLPEKGAVDARLSRRLTEQMRAGRKRVWLYGDGPHGTAAGESLSAFTDAVCLPVPGPAGEPAAALHVYRGGMGFTDRDVRFMEGVAGFLTPALENHRVRRKLEAENSRLRVVAPVADELIGDSAAVTNLRVQIAKAAPQSFTVLISGESGSGKELVAQALHRYSPRAAGPLVTVNCAAVAPTTMEAELFGSRAGAFGGPDRDRPGLFEQADEGTLFLDEVGELSPECQAKLLRAIEGKAFRPVGGTRDVRVDVRVVAATHKDLAGEVKAGRFRQDLLFRLNVIAIRVPPLREHAGDVPELARFFLERLSAQCRRGFKLTPAAADRLEAYPWPGNVRQLRAVLESAAVMSEGDTIDADGLPLGGPPEPPAQVPAAPAAVDAPASLDIDEIETWAIRRALRQTGGNVSQASRILGMSRDTLHTKLKKKCIDRDALLHDSAGG